MIFSRLKTRFSYFTTTIDENIDLSELRLLEWSNVDRNRLSQILQEISTALLHVKRPAQAAIANVLHRAIWNWINVHPAEYEMLVETNRKLDPSVDNLFDVLASISDVGSLSNAKRSKTFFPLMAMLLVVSPDTMRKLVLGETGTKGSGAAKKVAFLENCRKGITGNKGFEASVLSYIDFVKASVCLSPSMESSGVKSLVGDIQNDLKVGLGLLNNTDVLGRSFLIARLGFVRSRNTGRWPGCTLSCQSCTHHVHPLPQALE